MEHEITRNKMGTESVKKLLFAMGIPMILSMVLQAVYNVVDSYFVSCMSDTAEIVNRGEYGVNALTLAFPVQMLMVAVGVGTGVGINALLSKSLGEGDGKKVSLIAGNAVFLGICTYLVFLLFGIFGVDWYLETQTSNAAVLQMGNDYLGICTSLSFGCILFMIYEKLLQATGRTTLSTIAQVAGALANMILDPILIFGYFGLPELGIRGAAYATVIGQMISCILGAVFHYLLNHDVEAGISYLRPRKKVIIEIYKVGLPAIIMQALMSFMTYGVNIIFGTISTAAVTAYGIYYKIQQFVFFAAFGMNNAMIPVIGFNYGRGDKKRVKEGIRFGMLDTLVIMLLGIAGLQIFAGQLTGIFALTPETQLLCVRAIRIITLGYLFAGANIAYQGIFQALGYGFHSLVVSLLRLIVIALPLAWIFSKTAYAEELVWTVFPIAEGVAVVAAAIFMRRISSRRLK